LAPIFTKVALEKCAMTFLKNKIGIVRYHSTLANLRVLCQKIIIFKFSIRHLCFNCFYFWKKNWIFFLHFNNIINYLSSIIFLGPFLFHFFVGISIFLLQICWFKVHGIFLGFKIDYSRTPLLRNVLNTYLFLVKEFTIESLH